MNDKTKLKYLNATIMETQRVGNLAPLGINHATARDVIFKGYHIPKDTMIMPNFTSVLFDKTIWGKDAEEFR